MNSLPHTPESQATPNSGSSAAAWFARIPFKLMLFMIVISIAVEEFYPLSWFPMFTNLEKKTYYVYVTDESDRKLPMLDEFGWTGDRLDNNYKRQLSDHRKRDPRAEDTEHVAAAAQKILRQLQQIDRRKRQDATPRTLKLWRTDLLLTDDTLTAKDRVLATRSPQVETEASETGEMSDSDAGDDEDSR